MKKRNSSEIFAKQPSTAFVEEPKKPLYEKKTLACRNRIAGRKRTDHRQFGAFFAT